MLKHSTRPAPRLRCRQCGSTACELTGKTQPGIKEHHTHAIRVACRTCGHSWWSRSRAANALHPILLENMGQTVMAWDEMPLKKPLTRPPLPD